MPKQQRLRTRLKQAFAGFDEINTFWVAKMDLPPAEKQLRVEMMRDFRQRVEEVPKPEKKDNSAEYLMLAALGYVAYKALYIEFTQRFYRRYLRTVGAEGNISAFAESWIAEHAEQFAGYAHTDPQAAARTETNALGSLAQLDAYAQLGYEGKQWLTMGDEKVRQTHREAAGQIRALDEPFLVGDSLLMFPQDSSLGASAEEIINCRCTMKPVKRLSI